MEDEKILEELDKSKDLLKLEFANKVRNDLFIFDKYILGYDLMADNTHKGICKITESLIREPEVCLREFHEVEKFLDAPKTVTRDIEIFYRNQDINDFRKKFKLFLMPRGSFKSTCVTIGFTLQLFLWNPNIRILIDSETFDKSRAFLSEIKGHMESNEKYREVYKILHGLYPDANHASDKWSDTELNIAGKTRKLKEPSISCAGIGVTKVGMHYDLIICDDLQSEKNITTKDQIDTVINHYKLLLSLLEPDGIMVVIGTRWDYNDVYQYIIDNEKKRFQIYAKQAILPDGSLFFPERLTKEFLENIKISQGSSHFSNQYQNMPIDDETATFKVSQMKRVSDEVLKRPINWFLLVDPAISQEKSSDYSALVTAGFDYQRNLYVRHILRGKFMPSEIVDNIFRLYEMFQHKAIGLEVVSFQKTLKYSINDRMAERGWWLPLKEIKRKNTQSKEQRIKGLQPYYEFGRIFHLESCPNIDDLEYELIHFPRGQHDDTIDALADVLEIGYPPSSKQNSGEDQKKKKRLLHNLLKPRSRVTNY